MEVNIIKHSEFVKDAQDVLVSFITVEELERLHHNGRWFDANVKHIIRQAYALNDFKAAVGEILFLYPDATGGNIRIIVGLGSERDLSYRQVQTAGGRLAQRVMKMNLPGVTLDLAYCQGESAAEMSKPFVEGIAIGAYTFTKYFSESESFPLGRLSILISDESDPECVRRAIKEASIRVAASNVARHLTNEAANYKTPAKFEQLIKTTLTDPRLTVETLNEERLAQENLNLIRAVGQAGSDLPRMLIIEHRVPDPCFNLGIVVKAITFDSGGLMLKAHDKLPLMREDVGGAAAVVGALSVIGRLDLHYNLFAAVPIAENLIDSKAFRPSDVIITRRGISVEINNTDAEGRLLLADSFLYLQDRYELDALVDVATLTGAITRALGPKVGGYFSNSEDLSAVFQEAFARSREKFWRMPLERDYQPNLRSRFADIINDGGEPKAIVAALFLEHFLKPATPWLHLDVGCILEPPTDDPLYGLSPTSTGMPAITLVKFLKLLDSRCEAVRSFRTRVTA